MQLLSQVFIALILYGYVSNEIGRLGIDYCPGNHRIVKVFPHSPAQQAGLLPGDIVLRVDGAPPKGKHWGYGAPGEPVQLTLQRKHNIINITVVREIERADWR